jgi:hypothetical protein
MMELTAYGQTLSSAYFLDGYMYRHQMNPAFASERGYFSFPFLGNFNVDTRGNVGIADFLYPYDDPTGNYSLTTFMNSTVPQSEFLNNIHDNNAIRANLSMTLFSAGFNGFGGYNTLGISLRSNVNVNLPYGLFEFMKSGNMGGEKRTYNLHDMQFGTDNIVDISVGHSHAINDKLRIGATAKLLIGVGHVKVHFDKMDITMSEDEWIINANGYMETGIKGAYFNYKENDEIDDVDFDDNKMGVSGWGAAVDLGATYKLLDNLTLSASVIDLGFLRWSDAIKGVTRNDPYRFNGFETIGVGSDSEYGDFDSQMDDLGDDLSDLSKLYDDGKTSISTTLGVTINIGAEYELPAYRNLSFGLLSTTHINHPYTWTELRASANVTPVNWFDAAVSAGVSTYGPTLGFVMNFHPKGFNLFVGSDMFVCNMTPQYLPKDNTNANFCMGINFPIGAKK